MNKNIVAMLSLALLVVLLPACREKNDGYRKTDKMYKHHDHMHGQKKKETHKVREYRNKDGKKVRMEEKMEMMEDQSDM